jgi:hypothetical protein
VLGFPQRFGGLGPLGALSAVGERDPRRFRPAATFAHMLERRRLPLGPRLGDAGEEEAELSAGQAYSAGWSFAGSAAASGCVAFSADLRLTALVLPRLSCSRS